MARPRRGRATMPSTRALPEPGSSSDEDEMDMAHTDGPGGVDQLVKDSLAALQAWHDAARAIK